MNTPKPETPTAQASGSVVLRKRRMRRRVRRLAASTGPVKPKPERRAGTLTESEFVAWLRDLSKEPRYTHPKPWDEHCFRVGVLMELRRVVSPHTDLTDAARPGAGNNQNASAGGAR